MVYFTFAAVAAPQPAGGPPSVQLTTDQDVYHRIDASGQPEVVHIYFWNHGDDPVHLGNSGPWRAYDAHGHHVFSPVTSAAGVTVQPGERYEQQWPLNCAECFYHEPETRSQHDDATWQLVATMGFVPADHYQIVWTYFPVGGDAIEITTWFEVREGWGGPGEV